MLELWVNGEKISLDGPCPLTDLLERLGHTGGHYAVAVNGGFIPRHAYPEHTLRGGEKLEVLSPMQGG